MDLTSCPRCEGFVVGALETNCYLLWCSETGVGALIDPGDVPEEALSLAEREGVDIRYIISTHGHFDHMLGGTAAREATGAQLLVHRDDRELAGSVVRDAEFVLGRRVPETRPDAYLEDGQIIELGKHCLRVLGTPGHTPGAVCLAVGGIVFTGDTLMAGTVGRADLPGGNGPQLLESIRDRLLALPDDTLVLPGHGPETTIGEERRTNPFIQ